MSDVSWYEVAEESRDELHPFACRDCHEVQPDEEALTRGLCELCVTEREGA